MKVITLTQPWATLVTLGVKKIETRSWSTPYRGPLAIHAAKGFPGYAKDYVLAFQDVLEPAGYSRAEDLPRGVILAVCKLVACKQIVTRGQHSPSTAQHQTMLPPSEPELLYGDYTLGRYGWLLEEVRPLPEPIPAKGALGLWTPSEDVAAQLGQFLREGSNA